MSSVVPLERHSYDLLMKHHNPVAFRLNDARHQNISVGDVVEYSGRNTIMDRQRFKVVDKMHHPSIHDAVNTVQHSNLNARDKINMTKGFIGLHGQQSSNHQVVSLHLQPHPHTTSATNRSVGGLG